MASITEKDLFGKIKSMGIMLVDDDEWIRDSLCVFFDGEGCNIQALETAEEALQLLSKQPCGIIIADFRLPGIDGVEFFRRIQRRRRVKARILITAYANSQIAADSTAVGVQEIIKKPFTTDTLKASLARAINAHEGEEANRP